MGSIPIWGFGSGSLVVGRARSLLACSHPFFFIIMKIFTTSLLLGVLSALPLHADTVSIGDQLQVNALNAINRGGPYTLTNLTQGGSFVTFCLETNEYLANGEILRPYNISTVADLGGSGGPRPDPISTETAFLFWTYRMGNPYNWYAGDVQNAIWFLEEELWGVSNSLIPFATQAVQNGWTNNNRVAVLNLYRGETGTTRGQDVLATIPEPGSTVLFFLISTLALILFNRK